jgi:hypothetical protein
MNRQQWHTELDNWQSVPSGPFFEQVNAPRELFAGVLPIEYLEVIAAIGGREGWMGTHYVRFYRYEELLGLNQAYQIANYNPALFMFASDGYGEAYAFCIGGDEIVKFPLIPIPADTADLIASGFGAFVHELNASGPASTLDEATVGKELHLIKPLCFGGDWKDQANRALVDPVQYAELVTYWNKLYRDLWTEQHPAE